MDLRGGAGGLGPGADGAAIGAGGVGAAGDFGPPEGFNDPGGGKTIPPGPAAAFGAGLSITKGFSAGGSTFLSLRAANWSAKLPPPAEEPPDDADGALGGAGGGGAPDGGGGGAN